MPISLTCPKCGRSAKDIPDERFYRFAGTRNKPDALMAFARKKCPIAAKQAQGQLDDRCGLIYDLSKPDQETL